MSKLYSMRFWGRALRSLNLNLIFESGPVLAQAMAGGEVVMKELLAYMQAQQDSRCQRKKLRITDMLRDVAAEEADAVLLVLQRLLAKVQPRL